MKTKNLALTIALVSLLVSSLLANVDTDAVVLKRTEFLLSLQGVAPKLPADGGKYYAMVQLQTQDKKPVQAPFDMEIDMLSSDPFVISLPDKVTIKEGQTFAKVDLTTTVKAGRVTISGLGPGVSASMTTIETVRPEGLDPAKLAITSAPPTILPDPRFVGKLYVQILNPQGLPAIAKKPMEVTLSSGDSDVGTVPSKVIIDEGKTGKFVDYTPGIISGTTLITAIAPGLSSGTVTVKTVDLIGEKINIEIAPDVLPSKQGSTTLATIQLLSTGFPVKPSEGVTIFLKSSNDTVATVPSDVVIDPGQSYIRTEVTAAGNIGQTTITASASGYESGFADLEALPPATNGEKLVLYVSPSTLPPDNTSHNALVVAIQTECDVPEAKGHGDCPYTPRSGEMDILLTSSDTEIGSTDSIVEFEENNHFGLAEFTTRFTLGQTEITASQTGYEAAQTTLEVKGPESSSLKISQIPKVIEADGQIHDALVVETLDEKGTPVPAQRDTPVALSSSVADIVSVDPIVTIPEGQSYTIVSILTTGEAGKSIITASSQGLESDSITLTTSDSTTQNKIALYVVPEILPADGEAYESIVVQLQDLGGNPTVADSDILIALSSSSMIAGSIDRSVVIPAGSTYATASFTTSTAEDRITITASGQGYESVTDDLETTLQTLSVTTSTIPRKLLELRDIPMEVTVLSGDIPVKGAFVQVSGTSADVTSGVTDENGNAEVIYVPTAGGKNSIVLTVSKKGYSSITKNFNISITQQLSMTVKATTDGGRDIDSKVTIKAPNGRISKLDAKPMKPATLVGVKAGIYSITVLEEVNRPDGKYKFEKWSDGVTDNPRETNVAYDSTLAAVYSATYRLLASSPYGTVAGNGWYPEGSKVTLSITPTLVSDIIIDRNFAGWSGDVRSEESTVQVVMDSPKLVIADWADGYIKLLGIIGGGAGVAGFFFYKKLKTSGFRRKKEKPPELDWFKSE
ncbi:MAG: hypothetical protein ACE5J2_07575 [Nitrososphaerales archaeon]